MGLLLGAKSATANSNSQDIQFNTRNSSNVGQAAGILAQATPTGTQANLVFSGLGIIFSGNFLVSGSAQFSNGINIAGTYGGAGWNIINLSSAISSPGCIGIQMGQGQYLSFDTLSSSLGRYMYSNGSLVNMVGNYNFSTMPTVNGATIGGSSSLYISGAVTGSSSGSNTIVASSVSGIVPMIVSQGYLPATASWYCVTGGGSLFSLLLQCQLYQIHQLNHLILFY